MLFKFAIFTLCMQLTIWYYYLGSYITLNELANLKIKKMYVYEHYNYATILLDDYIKYINIPSSNSNYLNALGDVNIKYIQQSLMESIFWWILTIFMYVLWLCAFIKFMYKSYDYLNNKFTKKIENNKESDLTNTNNKNSFFNLNITANDSLENTYIPQLEQYCGFGGFKNIIGQKNVKKDLEYCIDYFEKISKPNNIYKKLGFQVPKGLLFVGPPGTGKTLMARSLAEECKISFINVVCPDLENKYYGEASKNVEKIFNLAKKNKPCIIYFDEIDCIAQNRTNFRNNSHSILNKLLSEMDGFKEVDDIIIIASTNVSKQLDPALVRSGRFDKKIIFDLPNINERKDIFNLNFKNTILSNNFVENYDDHIMHLAKMTAGASGADIKNIVNHSIAKCIQSNVQLENKQSDTSNDDIDKNIDNNELIDENINNNEKINEKINENNEKINENDKKINENDEKINENDEMMKDIENDIGITLDDVKFSIDQVLIGDEKRERLVTEEERKIIAYHEAGHALLAYILKNCHPPVKISIIPRGESALGFTMQEPDDIKIDTKQSMINNVSVLYGGRAAEKIIFDHRSTGASDDLQKATKICEYIVTKYAMDDDLAPLVYDIKKNKNVMNNIVKLAKSIEDQTMDILSNNEKYLHLISEYLFEHEVMVEEDIESILGDKLIKNTLNIIV